MNKIRLNLVITILVLIGLIAFCLNKQESFAHVKDVKLLYFLPLLFSQLLNYFFMGLIYSSPLKHFNISLTHKEAFALSNSSSLFNLLLPAKLGSIIRWIYLKRKFGFKFIDFTYINITVTLTGLMLLGLMGFITYYNLENFPIDSHKVSLVFLAIFITAFSINVFPIEKLIKSEKIKELKQVHLFKNKQTLLQIVLFMCGVCFLYPIKFYLSYLAIGIEIPMIKSIVVSISVLLLSNFQLLPGNLGTREAVVTLFSSYLGISPELAVLGTLVERSSQYLYLTVFGLLGKKQVIDHELKALCMSDLLKYKKQTSKNE
ncbi:MAG: uncharacterized membrane protein YbhN (UPF0104 family) [Thermoproteota archaeon]|jgi:uncharacterized membrane protein YbhN (UPF0104 family)